MTGPDTLGAALEREHRAIDGGIEAFVASDDAASADRLLEAIQGLRRHIYLEEAFLFPPMREAGMVMPIFVMLREHGALWRAMQDLDAKRSAGAERGSLVDACRELLSLLDSHNSKEEPVIYTQADGMLEREASAELQEFLRSGTMPEGWVCATA